MFMLRDKYERARKWQLEEKAKREGEKPEEYNGEKLYEPSIAEEMEKGDMLALTISAFLTILPICVLLLLLMVFIGYLFMRVL